MACQAHAVACQALVVACLVPMLWHVKPYGGMPCLVKPMSWHALSSPCRGMSSPCRGMACQAHAVACQALVVACLVPMIWHVKPYRSMPCQAHVVTCLVEPMSSPCCGMHALSNQCRGMHCANFLACQAVWLHALSSPCRGVPCQGHVEPMSSPCRGMHCDNVLACQAVWLHALSCFLRLPGDKHKSCHGMASPASFVFFYASFKKPLSWPSCYFSSDCLVPISRHAFRPCRGMPFQAHVVGQASWLPF